MIDKRLSELKAEESDLPRDQVQSEIRNLLQIRSLLLQGIDCSVLCCVAPKQSNSRALLMNKEDDCDGSSVKALELASRHCSKLTICNFEARPSKWPNIWPPASAPSLKRAQTISDCTCLRHEPYLRPSAPASSALHEDAAASLSSQHVLAAHAVASAQWAAKRADSKPIIETTNPKQVSDHNLHCPQ